MSLIWSISGRWLRSYRNVSHQPMKSYSLMGVVGRDQARRGQPVAKQVTQSVAQPVRHRERHQEQDRESHREMLARVKQFNADIDIDIGIESKLPKLKLDQEFDQELKDCAEEPRRESLRESLRAWLRVHVCLRESLQGSLRVRTRTYIQVCLHAERECCVMALGNQLRIDKNDCERMRVQIAHTSVPLNKANTSADSASSTTPLTRTTQLKRGKPRTTNRCNGCRQGNTSRIVAIGEIRFEKTRPGEQERFSWKYVLVQNVNACRTWQLG